MSKTPSLTGALILGVLVLMVLAVVLSSFVVNIEPGYQGILIDKTAGGVQPIPLDPGWHFKTPITQSVVPVEVRIQKYSDLAFASSKDQQLVNTTVDVNYQPAKMMAPLLYNSIGPDYAARKIQPVVQNSVKEVTARYTAEELISKREEVRKQIEKSIANQLAPSGIDVDGVYMTNFDFSKEYAVAIEQKQIAEQQTLKAKNDLNRIEIEANQTIIKSKAEAESISITGKALAENPAVIQLKAIEKWDGKRPLYEGSGNPTIMVPSPGTVAVK